MEHLARIASGVFAQYGVDFTTARRAGGWTNATWLAGGMALRLSTAQGHDKIRREVQLASLLPENVGYPTNIATGVTEGYEWSLSREIPGSTLSDVWPGLDGSQRSKAIRQIWASAQTVHAIALDKVGELARKRAWYNSDDAEEAEARNTRLVEMAILTKEQGTVVQEALNRFFWAIPTAPCVLNHGDITTDNIIWRQKKVVSLLDFEWSVVAPTELDLNSVLNLAFGPDTECGLDSKGLQKVQQTALDLAQPVLDHPGGIDLLMGYAVLLAQYRLDLWLANADSKANLEQWEPYRRVLSLADGRGGYLAPLTQMT
ncbi:MAG: phosphotransferase family protein [Bacillota bacterium]